MCNRQVANWISEKCVKPKRNNDHTWSKLGDCRTCLIERRDEKIIFCTSSKRNIEIGSAPLSRTLLITKAGEVWVCPLWVTVQRHILHIVTLVKNFLSAVAVVIVHIKHRDLCASCSCYMMCRNGCIVKEAISAIEISGGVMTWRPAQTICIRLTVENKLCCSEGCIDRRTSCRVGAFGERSCCLKTPPTKPSVNRCRLFDLTHCFTQRRTIKEIGHYFMARTHLALIIGPSGHQKPVQTWRVYCINRLRAPFCWRQELHT